MKEVPKPSYEDLEEEISRLEQTISELYGIQEKYRQLVQSANSIILRLTPQGDIKFINEFALEVFGYREAEILGRNVGGTILPTRDSFGRDLAVMIKDIASHPERYQINENENMRNNGESVWIAWTNRIIQDEHGQISEILCVGNDSTNRKRAEQAALESEAQFRALAESAPAAIAIIAGEKILHTLL
jgi:PAS domain S-box-containing protein